MTTRAASSSDPAHDASLTDRAATAAHPPAGHPDPTVTQPSAQHHDAAQGGVAAASASGPAELARLKVNLRGGLRTFPDFPIKGILFEDIMPLFSSPSLHADLGRALELQATEAFVKSSGSGKIDVVVGLESRGFLFGPTLALRLGAGFVPVRKPGKLPGKCVTAKFMKEYGADEFAMQADAIKAGQRVIIVDDIIATGGSAAAAGELVRQLGGDLRGYLFIMELDFLKGRDKLDAPVSTLLSGQEKALAS